MNALRYLIAVIAVAVALINPSRAAAAETSPSVKAYYIEFDNGTIQTLWTDWVDSMRVSRTAVDSTLAGSYVTQEIWLRDTVLRYPLASISRISFVTPAPVLNPGVTDLRGQLVDYIIGSDSLTLFLSGATPEALVPKKGALLCYPFVSDIFPAAFAGEVRSVSRASGRIAVECDAPSLLDIFDTYYSTYTEPVTTTPQGRADFNDPNYKNPQAHIVRWAPEQPIHINLSPLINYHDNTNRMAFLNWDTRQPDDPNLTEADIRELEELSETRSASISSGPQMSIDVSPDVQARISLIITPRLLRTPTMCVTVHMRENYAQSLNAAVQGHIEAEKTMPIFNIRLTPAPFVYPSIEFGGFLKGQADAAMALKLKGTQHNEWLYNFAVGEEPPLKNARVEPSFMNPEALTLGSYFSGSVSLGLYLGFNLNFLDRDIARITAKAEIGARADLDIAIPIVGTDTEVPNDWVYDIIRQNGFSVGPYFALSLDAYGFNRPIFGDRISYSAPLWRPLIERRLVPEISGVKASRSKGSPALINASADISGNCITGWELGFMIVNRPDQWSQNTTTYFLGKTYRNEKDFGKESFSLAIDSLATSRNYSIYPVLRKGWMEIPILPSAEVKKSLKAATKRTAAQSAGMLRLNATATGFDSREEVSGNIRYRKEGDPVWSEAPAATTAVNDTTITIEAVVSGIEPATYEYQAVSSVDGSGVESDIATMELTEQTIWNPVILTSDCSILLYYANGIDLENVTAYCAEGKNISTDEILRVDNYRIVKDEIDDLLSVFTVGVDGRGFCLEQLSYDTDYTVCLVYNDGNTKIIGQTFNVRTKPEYPDLANLRAALRASGREYPRLDGPEHSPVIGDLPLYVNGCKYIRNINATAHTVLENCAGYSVYVPSDSELNFTGNNLTIKNCHYDKIFNHTGDAITIVSSNVGDVWVKTINVVDSYVSRGFTPWGTEVSFNNCIFTASFQELSIWCSIIKIHKSLIGYDFTNMYQDLTVTESLVSAGEHIIEVPYWHGEARMFTAYIEQKVRELEDAGRENNQ